MQILMVCQGNICRSPLAEGILIKKTKRLDVKVDSSGISGYHIGEPADKRSIEIADKYNIDLRSHRARQFSRTDFDKFDVIFAMDTSNLAHLISLAHTKGERRKIRLILNEVTPGLCRSVADPYYGGDNGFQNTYNILDQACDKIIQNIE